MTRSNSAWTGSVLVLLIASLIPDPACAGYSGKLFPEFAGKKDSLGPVSIVADVAEIQNVKGNEKKVYLPDCMRLGEAFLGSFAAGLAAKGYQVQPKAFLSVGANVRQDFAYRIYSTPFKDRTDDSESLLAPPPFYVDPTLFRSPETIADWSRVLSGTWAYEKKKGHPGKPIPEAVQLRESLGTNHLFAIRVMHLQVSTGNRVGMAMLGMQKEGSFSYSVAMIDCRSGEVLWADWQGTQGPRGGGMKDSDVKFITDQMLKLMP